MGEKPHSILLRKGGEKKESGYDGTVREGRLRLGKRNYVLCLYVAGMTPQLGRAISNLKKICEEHLAGRYTST